MVDISTKLVQIKAMVEKRQHFTINRARQYGKTTTLGCPFLVSRICQHINGKLGKDWSVNGVQAAVKIILKEDNTLFDDMHKNMENNKNLYNLLHDVLIMGKPRTFARGSLLVKLGLIYGIIKETEAGVTVSNKIFESVIINKFIADNEI